MPSTSQCLCLGSRCRIFPSPEDDIRNCLALPLGVNNSNYPLAEVMIRNTPEASRVDGVVVRPNFTPIINVILKLPPVQYIALIPFLAGESFAAIKDVSAVSRGIRPIALNPLSAVVPGGTVPAPTADLIDGVSVSHGGPPPNARLQPNTDIFSAQKAGA
ncbi:hypothetical protein K438DRAFT_2017321 [Mycena galopus ATCC 62051]|nr:hypothetical protein K438DRAFT_2017321 [Mycena galopus ATCC 62051]